jgi:putative SOS response-associated peptidase YedK
VEQAAEGIAARDDQRASRDGDDQAVLPGAVQKEALSHARPGYYEWEDTPGGKQPHYFTLRDGSPVLTVAGLWDEWKNRETGERIKSCAMIITQPNEFVAEVHDRMPVLLQPDQFDHWISGNMTVAELKPAPNNYLQRWAVSKRVNSSKADKDDATLIEPMKQAA